MKKLACLLLAMLLVLSLVACRGNGQGGPIADPEPTPTTDSTTAAPNETEDPAENGDTEISVPRVLDNIGFTVNSDWTYESQIEAAFFFYRDSQIVVTFMGPYDIQADWDDPDEMLYTIFQMMLEGAFGARDLEITPLAAGTLGYAVLRADYTMELFHQSSTGIGFIVSDGEQLALISAALADDDPALVDALTDLIASMYFLD
ncbi:MAG: hypothetical protein FWC72_00980 [Oscillospiraceae bacterium]|nr:hypothetical protein [Oscillospiraceae bacterium]